MVTLEHFSRWCILWNEVLWRSKNTMAKAYSDDLRRKDFGGVRQGVRELAGVGGTVLRELCLGAEDILAAAAHRSGGAGGAATRLAEPGDGGSGSAVAPPVAGAARSHAGGVAAGVMGSRGGAVQYSASVATAPADGLAAKKSRSAPRSKTRRKTGSAARRGRSRAS